jgi:hypothetical protein
MDDYNFYLKFEKCIVECTHDEYENVNGRLGKMSNKKKGFV